MISAALTLATLSSPLWVEYKGGQGPGNGKHIVFLAGDEEYRSEEALPQLAKILSQKHGFRCTVLFSTNEKGEIDPNTQTNQPGIEALASADLCVMMLRFRRWPEGVMNRFIEYYHSGKPIIALRTSTHAFAYPNEDTSPHARFGWNSQSWPGGFGKQVLGETWISHWGIHGQEATRGVVVKPNHPILSGVKDVFGTTDVYEAAPPPDAEILMNGEVVAGMTPDSPTATGRKKTVGGVEQSLNDPMMPILWLRKVKNEAGKTNQIVTCTMGSATDLSNEGLRRVVVNAAYWTTGLSKKIKPDSDVNLVGDYRPSNFGFGTFRKGMKASDFALKPGASSGGKR